ncbi:MAG TPA: C40 family peptidase [Candidatus Pelethosoma merdigallinarum]|nr:C40 family peptidase [Candidatus Pelethosoma merdigallinarum]
MQSNGSSGSRFANAIKSILIRSAGTGCLIQACMLIIIVLLVIIALCTPLMAMDGIISSVEETTEDIGDAVSETAEKFVNFITLHGWNTNEESFHNELKDEYEKYKEDGIIIDTRLIMSIVFYDIGVDENEDYSCDLPEDADPDSDEYQECISGENDYDYAQLRSEVHQLVDGMIEDGQLKSEDDFKQWLKDNFIEDKLKSLDYNIPTDETAKEKLFDEFITTVYEKKGLYEELIGETTNNNQCITTTSPDEDSKQKVRLTNYSSTAGESPGATGSIKSYMKKGQIYLNDKGFYMWKGGTKGRNGSVYGEEGQDYLIVAASTKAKDVLGKYSSACKTTFRLLDDIRYFNYGDTFTLQVTTDGGKTYDTYNSIVLDTCGACMLYSPSVDSPCSGSISQMKETNNLKIDIYVNHDASGYKKPGDIGYFMDGTNSNLCIGTIDLGELEVGVKGTKSLNQPIEKVLTSQGIEELNQQIEANVNKYGRGTGNGVAAAAITLINGLKQKGYHLPYYFGGGHAQGITTGVDTKWGYPASKYDSSYVSSNASQGRTIYSYDCSAFVSWAMHNGGCPKKVYSTSNIATDKSMKKRSKISEAQPGDLLNDAGSHVMLVVQNNGGKVTLAESTVSGIQFSEATPSKIKGYEIWDMSGYYQKNCQA